MAEVLRFNQPKAMRHHYEILRGDVIAGSLTYKPYSGREADAAMDGKNIHMKRAGIVRPTVTITEGDAGAGLGTYQDHPFKSTGELHLGDAVYTFGTAGPRLSLKSQYAWRDAEGNELVTYKMGGVVHSMGEIAVSEALADSADRHILIPLGLYNSLAHDDSNAAAAGS